VNWLLVVVGAMIGAPVRYLTDRVVRARCGSAFPWGILLVNVAGSLLLGLLTGAAVAGAAGSRLQLLLGTGLCGALTTYSTFSYDTLRLAGTGADRSAVGNVLLSVAAGVGAAFAGVALGEVLWG
jgi:fluoride exporter